ncbi:GGDEF domain-containing phosphodiesterase [Rhizobium sp. AG855]|uniref:sensor domain-containing protein n=1 Tax=Rhizobium sp. AG855 TaxID=2183898 RepID=UPI000FF71192|nr:GGDEF domain-containing phosphodiesterase [Rhizobium sp. AG855]RKE84523.1 PAS domain S-box-containing protein/diguanylate cyclase (GGDEF)-like protein [Rhizobium sp. AG855]
MRKNAAVQAHSANARSLTLSNLAWPTALLDADGVILDRNLALVDILALTGTDSACFTDYLDSDDATALDLAKNRLLNPGDITQIEIRITAGTTVRHFLASLSRAPATAGAVLLQLAEITRLKADMADLAIRESRWNHALVSSASGVWDQRMNGDYYYSDIWRRIRGLGPNDPIPPTTEIWLESVHPHDREHVLHCIERQNSGDPAYLTFQYRERHHDGHYIWIECRGACIETDDQGRALRITGTDTDVTARKAQEEWQEGLSRRLRLALDISRIGVFETDFDAGISVWDDAMRHIFEVDEEDEIRIGDRWEEKLHPDDRERVLANVTRRIEMRETFTDDYRIIARDGSTRYIRANSLPYVDHDGRLKMIGVNWDVTEDRRLREELERQKALAEARNEELERTRIAAEHSALHDYLTGLPNRRFLEQRIDDWRAVPEAERHGIAILHIDLDRFKQINDTLGHSAGDAMLKHAAKILRDSIRPSDFAARIGGDEFVLLVAHSGTTTALSDVATRIIETMRQPVWYNGHECRFGASIGIAYSNDRLADPRQLLQNADIALYNAKNLGRNRYEFYKPSSRSMLVDAHRLSDELLRGLERDEIIPYYQLQFDARTRDITGAECLARWQHPEHGILGPDRFLAVAEDCGVIAKVDRIILEKSLADVARWKALGLDIPKISVNVSARRLNDPDLAQGLSKLDIKPGTVSFELLESVFLDRQDEVVRTNLETLRRLSIGIEIDDFGTGHASIVGLLNLKPGTLKIDRQLIEHLPESQEQRVLVMSIIQIARSLKIKVVAEGVETEEHARILKRLGCDVLQGYGLARPTDFERTTIRLREQRKSAQAG